MSVTMPRGFVLAVFACVAFACAQTGDVQPAAKDPEYGVAHTSAEGFSMKRPECPRVWDTMPVITHHGRGRASSATIIKVVVPPGGIPGPGITTNIPEFHDCQRFLLNSGRKFDSLYAIFASYQMDSIVQQLNFDSVTWASSNAAVATVTPSGIVTAVGAGAITVTATSVADPLRKASVAVTIVPGAGTDTVGTMTLTEGAGGLPALQPGQSVKLSAALGAMTTSTLAVAVIYTYGPGYQPLAIGAGFSCLYLYFNETGTLAARMVAAEQTGTDPTACNTAINPQDVPGKDLTVIRRAVFGVPGGGYPSVARWDYDEKNHQQYAGIRCGNAWCEVGAPGAVAFTPSPGLNAGMIVTAEERVAAVKGWHDRQYLAVAGPGNTLVPSRVRGMVIPAPGLRAISEARFRTGWAVTGYVAIDTVAGGAPGATLAALDEYKQKMNLDYAPLSFPLRNLNRISLCFGTRDFCGVPVATLPKGCGPDNDTNGVPIKRWWSRLEAAKEGPARYRCVIRRTHGSNIELVATARWRWLAIDDTYWEYCDAGCCEVVGGPTGPIP